MSKMIAMQGSVYQELLAHSMGRNTPYEKLSDILNDFFAKTAINEDDRVGIISSTLSQIIASVTTECLRASVSIVQTDAKLPYEIELLRAEVKIAEAKIEEAKANVENAKANIELTKAKIAQSKEELELLRQKAPVEIELIRAQTKQLEAETRLTQEKLKTIPYEIELLKAQAEDARSKICETNNKSQLYKAQGSYYATQPYLDALKVEAETINSQSLGGLSVKEEAWSNFANHLAPLYSNARLNMPNLSWKQC